MEIPITEDAHSSGGGALATVLVVEDELIIASELSFTLERLGYKVVGTAVSGEEAVRLASALRPGLVLMDILLKGSVDGIMAASMIRSERDIPVVYLTSYTDEQTIERAKATSPYGYLAKPFDERDLRITLDMARYKHNAEHQLRAQNALMRSLMDAVTHPLVVVGVKNHDIMLANAAAKTLSPNASDCSSLLGSDICSCSAEKLPGCPVSEAARLRKSASAIYVSSSGDRTFEAHAFPIIEPGGDIERVVLYSLDITERKRLERLFQESQKMESVGRLAGGVAHDFSNVLSVIIGYCEMAAMDLPEGDPVAEKLDLIREAAERGAALTSQLLMFSSRQTAATRPVDINEAASSVVRMLERVIGENIKLTLDLEDGIGNVLADRRQIEQILMNLAVNARDAMPGGGRITLATRSTELAREFASAMGVRSGPTVLITFSDTGEGMTPEVRERIFEPFFTTKGVGKGTGLGLATVYGIIKQHGGFVQVQSAPGKGTSFNIWLPVTEEAAVEEKGGARTHTQLPRGTETVMVVDDDPLVRGMAGAILMSLGYSVVESASAEDALGHGPDILSSIDVLLTDIVMDGAGGAELARSISGVAPHMRIVLMSGYADRSRETELPSVSGFLPKPFTPASLAGAVRNAADEGKSALGGGA